jgi:tRNA threonylcarbamoyladenosine biosynthesis protein TsaE|tara:strand:- start:622 stop:1065 length:444 start_codon:yes stop_codon:yes gene_type:complete
VIHTSTSGSPEETVLLGAELAASLEPGDVVALSGELGSGKTTFVQGLARGLGVAQFVNSPTFKIVNELEGRIPLYHLDFYRINSEEELINLGIEHYLFSRGVAVIEWADRYPHFLPKDAFRVEIECPEETSRKISINHPTHRESVSY